jgi:hypothetical protein
MTSATACSPGAFDQNVPGAPIAGERDADVHNV